MTALHPLATGLDAHRARLEELVQQYGRLIKRVVARVAGPSSPLIGQDVEQEVALALWRQITREQDIQHPASYIYRVAVRETVRRLRRECGRMQEPLEEMVAASVDNPSHDPHVAFEAKDRSAKLHAAVDGLSQDRRRAVRAHLQGFDVADIMHMYGWSYQKARNLIARGIGDLRKRLREDAR